jgi:3-oxoadipate enol-lactonase
MDFIELNGTGLRYELSGKGDRTLVLVHEMGGSLESWDGVVPRFAESRRVLRYDARGAGLSQKVRGELGVDTMADDIAALLDALGIAGKVALVGVAVGGAIALHFAARYPARTSAVVVGSPATGVAAERRVAALERLTKIEAAGMGFAVADAMQTAMLRSFAATWRALNDTARDGSATILRAIRRSGECWRASTCRRN